MVICGEQFGGSMFVDSYWQLRSQLIICSVRVIVKQSNGTSIVVVIG